MIKMFKKVPRMIKSSALFGLAMGIVLGSMSSWVLAIGEGQIEGGDIYRIKNVTKSLDFSKVQTADKCDLLQYKIRLHNPGPGVVNNVVIKASLPSTAVSSYTSTTTITSQNSQPAITIGQATINLSSSQKLAYVAGSTKLLDTYSNQLSSLSDGVTGGGINIGSVGVSLMQIRFVTFQVKVDCGSTPPPVDVCPNLDGIQTTIPAGYIKDSTGKCVLPPPPTDVCPNLDGIQTTIPAGYIKDSTGKCVLPPPPTDVCPNIDGVQTTIPAGMIKDSSGNCVTPPTDVCPNIDGIQTTIPAGYIKDSKGDCVKKPEQPKPVFRCDYVDIHASNDRSVKITQFVVTAKDGAVYKNSTINWGDSGGLTTVSDPVGQSHSYSADGTYVIRVTAYFMVNGVEKVATSASCSRSVTFKTTEPPVVPPVIVPPVVININNQVINNNTVTPAKMVVSSDFGTENGQVAGESTGKAILPDTGAGSMVAVFLAVSTLSGGAYYLLSRRYA